MNRKIAVITPYHTMLRQWCIDNNIDIKDCVLVNTIEAIRGMEFSDVKIGYLHEQIDRDVYESALLRIRD